MKSKRIMIFSHPHAGSTLLINMIGKCDNVHQIIEEKSYIPKTLLSKDKEFTIAKFPLFNKNTKIDDSIKIFLIRDTQYALFSLFERFPNEIPKDHKMCFNIKYWEWYIKRVYDSIYNINEYPIRYSDIFDKNKLKNICLSIGINYTDNIYNQYPRYVKDKNIPTNEPDRTDHLSFRQFQINKPIQNMNTDDRKVYNELIKQIKNIKEYNIIFGDN